MSDAARTFCFGKLPLAGDFLHGVDAVPEFAELDDWIQHGMYKSQQQLGADWQARFDALPPARFLWTAERGVALAGWWRASRDAVGRRYPFLVGARVPATPTQHALLPVALDDFFAAARGWLDGICSPGGGGRGVPEVIAQAHALPCAPDLAASRTAQAAALQRAATAACWAGHGDRAELLMHDLQQAAREGSLPYSLRWPSRGEGADLAFWLAAMAHFGAPAPRLVLWHGDAAAPGVVRAVLGELTPRQFAGVLFFDRDDDDAYDIGRDHGDARRLGDAVRDFAAAVAAPTAAAALAALPGGRR
ncbi:MAG: type VI secretion system-associated protein TagF [Planctomycetes bacterium]|nr:type VI secretion system-associated protein TagF [Planctomycetota bacterium]